LGSMLIRSGTSTGNRSIHRFFPLSIPLCLY